MRIVFDSNIAFSAILNTNSKIARMILQPKSRNNFQSTEQLLFEIKKHKRKLKEFNNCSEIELDRIIILITNKIRFINVKLIPAEAYQFAQALTKSIDIDDTEFVALTEHIKGKLWSGDKKLIQGLNNKGWKKFITTDELYNDANKKGK